jgi:hypothetical protein
VKIERARRRRERRPEPTPSEPQVGALAPGVRQRRHLEPAEHGFDDRLRRSLAARRGIPTGATFWRPGGR